MREDYFFILPDQLKDPHFIHQEDYFHIYSIIFLLIQ